MIFFNVKKFTCLLNALVFNYSYKWKWVSVYHKKHLNSWKIVKLDSHQFLHQAAWHSWTLAVLSPAVECRWSEHTQQPASVSWDPGTQWGCTGARSATGGCRWAGYHAACPRCLYYLVNISHQLFTQSFL